jgi:hypothetical protein
MAIDAPDRLDLHDPTGARGKISRGVVEAVSAPATG